MQIIKVDLYVIRFPLAGELTVSEVPVYVELRKQEATNRYWLVTPYASYPFVGDDFSEQAVIRQAGEGYYVGATEALTEVGVRYPFAKSDTNERIRQRLCDAIKYRGTTVGPGIIADAIGADTFGDRDVYAYARGKLPATYEQAEAAEAAKL